VQTCIVHLIRHSLKYVPRRQYDQVAKDLRPIYTAIDADAALQALEAFEQKWGQQLPVIGQTWRAAWEHVTPFMAFEPEVRRVIYTTDENVKGAGCRFVWFSVMASVGVIGRRPADRVVWPLFLSGRGRDDRFRARACVPRVLGVSTRKCRLALGFAQGVVDPRAKCRVWGFALPRSLPR
jgi:Transposase, Mutator family